MRRHDVIDIPESTREAWQQAVDILADVLAVPAALIVRRHDASGMEVFVTSDGPGNPHTQGASLPADPEDVFGAVVASGAALRVPNALKALRWRNVPAARQGLIAYLGMPLLWPDGEAFGALCVLDDRENAFSVRYERLLEQFRRIVEQHLALLFQHHELKEKTRRDSLTGAGTRREFFENARAEVKRARRYGHPLSLMLLDLDRFKQINDRHGHACGDTVLREVSHRIMDSLRSCDRYYRFGGEEFVVVLPHTALADALLVAERTRALVHDRPVAFGDREVEVTLSIGLAHLESGGESLDDIVAKADQALYAAKEGGRDRVECFERLADAEDPTV
ncbi:MAG: sensor domain-containing diguanylate cyclase [Pseudomonadales bacterium]|jgi:diguanylate cyclase (GGDEF)-like protein|nr:sensor domain-containing diguanylate cyclase [Pseudomonadales bacterium]